MFTLFKKDAMLILVCICIVIPSKLLKPAEHVHVLCKKKTKEKLKESIT